jgi:hypothetical protein
MLEIPVVESQTLRNQIDDSKRVEFTFSKEQFEKFEKVKGLLAHKNFQKKRTQSMADVLETAFDEIIAINTVFEKKPKMKSETVVKPNATAKAAKSNKYNMHKQTDGASSKSPEANLSTTPTQSRTAAEKFDSAKTANFNELNPDNPSSPNPTEKYVGIPSLRSARNSFSNKISVASMKTTKPATSAAAPSTFT